MPELIWKDIPDYEGLYQVNNIGQVRAIFDSDWRIAGRLMKPRNKNGYITYTLTKDGRAKHYAAHRAVMLAFHGKDSEGGVVNHINGIRDDNRLENLEWCTQAENISKAYQRKPWGLGEKCSTSKLTEENVIMIVKMKGYIAATYLAKTYGVGPHTIHAIWTGRSWSHLTGIKRGG